MSSHQEQSSNTTRIHSSDYVNLSTTAKERSIVKRGLSIAALVTANLLVLAALAKYFSGQKLELVTAIGIVADSVGVVTGLLGVWFFFLSERLNTGRSLISD